MKIALVGHGLMPIPPVGWGAVEIVIWNYKIYLEKAGHEVTIYNDPSCENVIKDLNSKQYDFIHLHSSSFVGSFNKYLKDKYCATSHDGGWQEFIKHGVAPDFEVKFRNLLQAPGNIVLSNEIKDFYLSSGYKNFIKSIHHGVEVDKFNFKENGNGKAICLGVISARKRQSLLAQLINSRVRIDFVGPWNKAEEPAFKESSSCKYLGEWSREKIHKDLTQYSSFILLSQSEASTPLVVLEALAAGVSVVISKHMGINLEQKKFITLLDEDELTTDGVSSVLQQSIDNNDSDRNTIRRYAETHLDYKIIIQDYIRIIEEFNSIK